MEMNECPKLYFTAAYFDRFISN